MIDSKNIGINFFAGSITALVWKNPSFNVIEFDVDNMIPVNIWTYSYDFIKASVDGVPTWSQLHDYLSYYNLPDFRPDHIFTLAQSLYTTESLATRYIWDQSRRVRA